MTHENTTQEDAISLLDIWCFLQRRYKVIGVVFLLVFGAIATYALTRPTMYEASANVQIGERFYFTKTAQSQSPLNFLIETPEQIKLLYSGQANINPIKNTRIVQIVAKKENAAEAQAAVQNVLAQIVAAHQAELDSKREEFIQLLGAVRPNAQDMVEILDVASVAARTRQLGTIHINRLEYAGLLYKTVVQGLLVALFLAFCCAGLIDYIVKAREQRT